MEYPETDNRQKDGLSVVMATYSGDQPDFFRAAGQSVLKQTCPPDEMILVVDGPIGLELEEQVKQLMSLGPVRVIRNQTNLGRGGARHVGILAAKYSLVALMDADDISLSDRFEKQLAVFSFQKHVDVVGGIIQEFDLVVEDASKTRVVPENHEQINKWALWRSPMNNVTIMFRRSSYLAVGGYHCDMVANEDYELFVRMLQKGFQFYNLQDLLVYVRTGPSMIERRGCISFVRTETVMLWRIYRSGFLSFPRFLLCWFVRVSIRLMPSMIRKIIYTDILRRKD